MASGDASNFRYAYLLWGRWSSKYGIRVRPGQVDLAKVRSKVFNEPALSVVLKVCAHAEGQVCVVLCLDIADDAAALQKVLAQGTDGLGQLGLQVRIFAT